MPWCASLFTLSGLLTVDPLSVAIDACIVSRDAGLVSGFEFFLFV